jgi:cytochrome P450
MTEESRRPTGSRLMGDLSAYNADPLGFMANTARSYGEVVPLRFGPQRAVMLTDPTAIEVVLIRQHASFRKAAGVRRLRTLLGNGLVLSEGDFWLKQRRMMQPAFHRAAVARYGEVMQRRTQAMLDGWEAGATIDAVEQLRALTLGIAVESLFGAQISEDEIRLVGSALATADAQLQTRVSSLLMFLPDWVPTPGNRRMNRAIAQLDRLVGRIIEAGRERPDERDDLLSLLMRATDDGAGMSDRQLRDEALTLLVAGHETTALTLAWALYLIARDAGADQILHAELSTILDGRPSRVDDIERLTFTRHIVSETTRLYPVGYVTVREALRDVEVNGQPIRRGTVVILPQWVMHRDSRYFDEPEDFRPQRWAEGLGERLPRGAYFPFGMGPRQCIGAAFATQEAVLALASIRQRFRLELVSSDDIHAVPTVTLQPDRPIRLRTWPS